MIHQSLNLLMTRYFILIFSINVLYFLHRTLYFLQRLNRIIRYQYFRFSSCFPSISIMTCRQRLIKCLHISIVFFDVRVENFSRIIREQKFSFDISENFQVTFEVIFGISLGVMPHICIDIRRVAIDKSIFGVSALDDFVGFILLYLRIADSINEIGSKQIHFIFKNL